MGKLEETFITVWIDMSPRKVGNLHFSSFVGHLALTSYSTSYPYMKVKERLLFNCAS